MKKIYFRKVIQKTLILVALLLFSLNVQAQEKQGFVVNKNKDTIQGVFIKHGFKYAKFSINGKKIKYKAKNIYSYYTGNNTYESGRAKLNVIGFKKMVFLTKVISGDLNMYSFLVRTQSTISSQSSSGFDHTTHIYFARKSSDVGNDFTKMGGSWKKNLKKLLRIAQGFLK